MKKLSFCFAIFLLFFFTACQSTQVEDYSEALTLKNGIPVYIQQSEVGAIQSIKLVFRDHSYHSELAGLEAITLALLLRGSENYTFTEIRQAQYEMSSSLSVSTNSFDYSSYNLNTLDKYFDDMFPLYADLLLNPAFNAQEFETIRQDMLQNKQRSLGDPYSRASSILNKEFFGDHPYSKDFDGTLESLSQITLDDVKNHYYGKLAADRMFIVAVGNFDDEQLLESLNASFGSIEKHGLAVEKQSIPAFSESSLILEPYAQSEGLAEVRGNFLAPAPTHTDYPAFSLASSMMDDILFEILRTRNSASYSTWTTVFNYEAGYGNISAYRTDVPHEVKKMLDDSVAVLAAGYAFPVEVEEADRLTNFVPIQESLEAYKNQYLTAFYSTQQSNLALANSIAHSVYLYNDAEAYLNFTNDILAVTAQDVQRVTNKYLLEAPKQWIVLGSPDLLDKVDSQSYLEFRGQYER